LRSLGSSPELTIMITGHILAVANGINGRRHSPWRTTRVDPRLDPNAVPLLPRYMVYEENNENHHFVECFVGREGNTQVTILGDLGEVSTIVLDYAGGACSLVARAGHTGQATVLSWAGTLGCRTV
jgi:hypothetical protein